MSCKHCSTWANFPKKTPKQNGKKTPQPLQISRVWSLFLQDLNQTPTWCVGIFYLHLRKECVFWCWIESLSLVSESSASWRNWPEWRLRLWWGEKKLRGENVLTRRKSACECFTGPLVQRFKAKTSTFLWWKEGEGGGGGVQDKMPS